MSGWSIDLESVQRHVVEWSARDEDLVGLSLFRGGNLSPGMLRSRWNLLMALKDAEVPTINDFVSVSERQKDEIHFCGLHKETHRAHWRGLFNRLHCAPEILALDPTLHEYIKWVAYESGIRLYWMDRIPRWAYRTKQPWRKMARPVGVWIDRARVVTEYPYIKSTAIVSDEHAMLQLAHRVIPKGLPHEFRSDLCQDLIVELLTGEITEQEAEENAKEFVKRSMKKYSQKYSTISLESPIFEDKTLGDYLSSKSTITFEDSLRYAGADGDYQEREEARAKIDAWRGVK